MSKTFMMLKPDAVERGLVKDIINDLNEAGLVVQKFDVIKATSQTINEHYAELIERMPEKMQIEDKINNTFINKFVVPMIIIGIDDDVKENIIEHTRSLIGATEPKSAEEHTIRGRYGMNDSYKEADEENRMVNNLIHASDSIESVEKEIKLWFKN